MPFDGELRRDGRIARSTRRAGRIPDEGEVCGEDCLFPEGSEEREGSAFGRIIARDGPLK